MISFASVNGPSVVTIFPPLIRTVAPFELCCRPPIETIFPALAASSPSFPISSINSIGGGPEAAKFSSPFTIIM
jgi:hypothetical protein